MADPFTVTVLAITLFSSFSHPKEDGFLVGDPRVVRNLLLDFLSPIGHHHPVQILSIRFWTPMCGQNLIY
jgi:hypothetical protein